MRSFTRGPYLPSRCPGAALLSETLRSALFHQRKALDPEVREASAAQTAADCWRLRWDDGAGRGAVFQIPRCGERLPLMRDSSQVLSSEKLSVKAGSCESCVRVQETEGRREKGFGVLASHGCGGCSTDLANIAKARRLSRPGRGTPCSTRASQGSPEGTSGLRHQRGTRGGTRASAGLSLRSV